MPKEHRIRISEGNRKMGFIPSVSLPPVKTCAADIPCTRECYVVKNMIGGPWGKSIAASYAANLAFYAADPNAFFSELARYIERKSPDFFRFHVSGDYIDSDHLQRAIVLAKQFPQTGFLAFTKHHSILPPARMIPENFALVQSLWPQWGTRKRGYRVAWMQDGTETRIPDSALFCPGNCETCGACWSLRNLKRDVYFKKH